MICTVCGKNKASIFIRQVINGKTKEFYICKDCVQDNRAAMEDRFGADYVQSIFDNLMNTEKKEAVKKLQKNKDRVCPECGTSIQNIKEKKMLGCSACFFYFQDIIMSCMNEQSGNIFYSGELPEKLDSFAVQKPTLEQLKEELERAVAQEHYELAAYFRDTIKKMEE